MRKQSQVRIAGRRQSALARRQVNLADARAGLGKYQALTLESREAKVLIAETDIANLQKKGVREAARG